MALDRFRNGLKTLGSNIANWYNANKYYGELPENANTAGQIYTTGNRFVDAGIGALAGLGQVAGSRQGNYFPSFNYVGNGLARSGISYMPNAYSNGNGIDMNKLGSVMAGILRNTGRLKKFNYEQPTNILPTGGDFNKSRIYKQSTPFEDMYLA